MREEIIYKVKIDKNAAKHTLGLKLDYGLYLIGRKYARELLQLGIKEKDREMVNRFSNRLKITSRTQDDKILIEITRKLKKSNILRSKHIVYYIADGNSNLSNTLIDCKLNIKNLLRNFIKKEYVILNPSEISGFMKALKDFIKYNKILFEHDLQYQTALAEIESTESYARMYKSPMIVGPVSRDMLIKMQTDKEIERKIDYIKLKAYLKVLANKYKRRWNLDEIEIIKPERYDDLDIEDPITASPTISDRDRILFDAETIGGLFEYTGDTSSIAGA